MTDTLQFVFTDFPGPGNECVFVEVETPDGKSVNVGEWRKRPDGLAELVLTSQSAELLSLRRKVEEQRRALEQAMRLLTRIDVAQYLMANTRERSNGSAKATFHDELTKLYVAVFCGVDPDRVRRSHEPEYKAVHDTTAVELTNHLPEKIGFDLDGFVDDKVQERFFKAFHEIAARALAGDKP